MVEKGGMSATDAEEELKVNPLLQFLHLLDGEPLIFSDRYRVPYPQTRMRFCSLGLV
jgi:hypothetical protein